MLSDRYELEEPIASGGMATVWRGKDRVLARPVAVKLLHEAFVRDPEFLERFRREAVAAARLTHPRIVNVYDTGVDGDRCFIIMELFDGETLEALMRRSGPLEAARAVAIMRASLEGLGFAHSEGLVHRDVKPGNILVGRDGLVKVADFGIAKAAYHRGDITTTGAILGTVRYLAPEQVSGGEVDPRTDLYACGVVMYEALSGRPPFQADTDLATAMMRLTTDPPPVRAVRPRIPRDLEALVMRAIRRDPEQRFQTAGQMGEALDRLAVSRAPSVPRPPRPPPPPSAASPRTDGEAEGPREPSFFRSWVLVPLVILLLAAVAVGVGIGVGELEFGGPLGIRLDAESPAASPPVVRDRPLDIVDAVDHDPAGGDTEQPEDVPLAFDENPDTYWETENYYSSPLSATKPGVGLIFDLGVTRTVRSFEVVTDLPGWEFTIIGGDSPEAFADPPVDERYEAGARGKAALRPTLTARYVLLWITDTTANDRDGFSARIAEVRFFGR